jgi:hypothetical protein
MTGETSGFHAHTCLGTVRSPIRSGRARESACPGAQPLTSVPFPTNGFPEEWVGVMGESGRARPSHRFGGAAWWKWRIPARDRGLVGAELAATPTR